MARYPTFGMEDFDSDMKKYVKLLVESLGAHQGRIRVQYKTSKDEIRIMFNNPSNEEIVLIVKRDIDRVRFYMPVRPVYRSVDEITRNLYQELIFVRRPSTPEFVKPDRWFGEWKIEYDSEKKQYYFCLVHDDVLTQLDEGHFERIFMSLWVECMWYHQNYEELT